MNMSYEWAITAMKKAPTLDGLSNVITHINFKYTGTDADSGHSAVFNGACPLVVPEEGYAEGDFIALADLTEAKVIEWAKAAHPTNHMNSLIEEEINRIITPTNVEVTGEELSFLAPPAESEE
jgi:hypothetical protein